jgi:ABC-type lipoprotein release transport system permease subunit
LTAARVITGLVHGVRAADPRLMALSIVIVTLTAALAGWIPADRASSMDPLVALRHE